MHLRLLFVASSLVVVLLAAAACTSGNGRGSQEPPTASASETAAGAPTVTVPALPSTAGTTDSPPAGSEPPPIKLPPPPSGAAPSSGPTPNIFRCQLPTPVLSDDACASDADCGPATPCHATACVAKAKSQPPAAGIMCTREMRCNSADANRCGCYQGRCGLIPPGM